MARNLFSSVIASCAIAGLLPAPGGVGGSTEQTRNITVSAAASLTNVLEEIAQAYEQTTSRQGPLELLRGPIHLPAKSSQARRSISSSARIRGKWTGSRKRVCLHRDTRVDLLSNQLVVVSPDDHPSPPTSDDDLLEPTVRRITIANPEAGTRPELYTRQYLISRGLWPRIYPKVIPTSNVRAALAAVEAGHADAAFVYRTDAAIAARVVIAFEIPIERAPRIVYPAAVASAGRETAEARRFLAFLTGPEARAIFEHAGFIVLAEAADGDREDFFCLLTPAFCLLSRTCPLTSWQVASFTVAVAFAATLLMLPAGVLLAWLLARHRFTGHTLIETAVSLPLVMPPVATGLILLNLFARRGPIGRLLDAAGIEVIFTWRAVVLAMAVMGLPLLVRTARAGFEQVDRRYEQIAETLGAGRTRVFLTISLPLAARGVLAGTLLAFSRALGEFGATVMVAGSIPGSTRTLASGIYSYTETGDDAAANGLLMISIMIAFGALWASNRLARGKDSA